MIKHIPNIPGFIQPLFMLLWGLGLYLWIGHDLLFTGLFFIYLGCFPFAAFMIARDSNNRKEYGIKKPA